MHRVALPAELLGGGEPARAGADDADGLSPFSAAAWAGVTQPRSNAVSVMKRSTAPMVTLRTPSR